MSTWVRNTWQVAAFGNEVGRTLLSRRICDEPILFYRTEGGDPVAMQDRCPHRLVRLSAGFLVGDTVRCGYHGLVFGADGRCLQVPGESQPPSGVKIRLFPIAERYGLIWVWVGEADLADRALIPDVHWNTDPAWTPSVGYHHMGCNFRLVTDNLLDLSHETYIHKHTIGNAAVADSPVRVTLDRSRVIRAHRDMPNIEPPPFFSMLLGRSERIHRWQTAIYMPPGLHITEAGFYPVDRDRSEAFVHRVLHLLTPETEYSAHYFWSTCRNYRRDEDDITRYTIDATTRTFNEDKDMLEGQQAELLRLGEPAVPQLTIAVDAAPIQARRLLARLVQAEADDAKHVHVPVPLIAEDVQPAAAA